MEYKIVEMKSISYHSGVGLYETTVSVGLFTCMHADTALKVTKLRGKVHEGSLESPLYVL